MIQWLREQGVPDDMMIYRSGVMGISITFLGKYCPDQEGLTFADTIEDPLGSVEDSGVFFNVFYETLSDNEKKVIELKLYGHRQEDAAHMMGITQSGFSRIKNRILDKYMGRRKHENQKPVQRKDNDMGSV